MTLTQVSTQSTSFTYRIRLKDNAETTVYIARYDRAMVRPRVVTFKRPIRLLDWSERENVTDAIVGGFFLRSANRLLGEYWVDGKKIPSVPFDEPWDKFRGSLHVNAEGQLSLGPRYKMPKQPAGDLMQAGPRLVKNGKAIKTDDPEGFSSAHHQFDTDITVGRYARAAIGVDDTHIWCVATDGRQCVWHGEPQDGLTLHEFAQFLKTLGIVDALNLDGGSSTSLVSGGKLLNRPRSDHKLHPRGRAVRSAIVFDPIA